MGEGYEMVVVRATHLVVLGVLEKRSGLLAGEDTGL